jgi:dienelactone hydrolase
MKTVALQGRSGELRARLSEPPGRGPFPAVIWHHGSEREPADESGLAAFYNAAGYAFLAPHRRGHGSTPGAYFADSVLERARGEASDVTALRALVIDLVIEVHEQAIEDTIAAVRYLERRPSIAAGAMFMSGVSHGAIQTLLAAEADIGMRAYLPFAPGATAWAENPVLRARLMRAVEASPAPIFLIQAGNDHNLGPSEALGSILGAKGQPNRVRVYPPFGASRQAGHGAFALEGFGIWGADVLDFLVTVIRTDYAGDRRTKH